MCYSFQPALFVPADNVEVKKLVYLYLINYAKSNPDLTLMAVNAFVKDSEHPSPLIRALAIRTMGCIRVDRITEYLAPPLKKALNDEDPYVRKTAALCVAKLHEISPSIVKSQMFMEKVRDLLSDSNPTVVANAVAALNEISESSGREVLEINRNILSKLIAALSECTEWGQVFILDSLAKYVPTNAAEAENLVERITPRLQHQNPAVVLSACKVIILYMEHITDPQSLSNIARKLSPSLITLAQSSQPEVQYVALRNIHLIVQRRPNLLSHKIKVFFCKYNDPIYVKMEKLDILVKLVTEKNVESVLLELTEYASEVDVEYVRRAVRTIGRCAIKLESAAEKCIKVLLHLIASKVNYVVQEAVVVIKDIFRRYPNRYEAVITVLCGALESLDEPEAKASMIWIIGEYADRIDNATDFLRSYVESFHEETTAVQLQLLTATVKLFLKKPREAEALVQSVLTAATENSDNPDLRDRGYIYWRLLSTDPDAAKAVILAERPVISDDSANIEPTLLEILTKNIATLSSVYHKTPESFVRRTRAVYEDEQEEEDEVDEEALYSMNAVAPAVQRAPQQAASTGLEQDLLGLGLGSAPAAPVAAKSSGTADLDIFGLGATSAPVQAATPSYPEIGNKDGIVAYGAFSRKNDVPTLELVLKNDVSPSGAAIPISTVAIKFNVNSIGVEPRSQSAAYDNIPVGGTGHRSIPLTFSSTYFTASSNNPTIVQVALKDIASNRVIFVSVPVLPSFTNLLDNSGPMDRNEFVNQWKTLTAPNQHTEDVTGLRNPHPSQVADVLNTNRIFFIADRPGPDASTKLSYFSGRTADLSSGGVQFLVEIAFKAGFDAVRVVVKSQSSPHVCRLAAMAIANILKNN